MSRDVLAQCSATYRLLTQSDRWVDRGGELHDLDAMSVRYKANIVGFLERRAVGLADFYSYGEILSFSGPLGPSGEMAQDSLDQALEEADRERRADPLKWLRSTPLLQRLRHDVKNKLGGEDDGR